MKLNRIKPNTIKLNTVKLNKIELNTIPIKEEHETITDYCERYKKWKEKES